VSISRLQLGEQVKAQTPLFALVTDRRPWLEANFKETDLTHVTVGQKAKVVLDMHPDVTWDAEVESISPATGAEFAILPAQNASGNWVKVVQRLPVRLRLIEQPRRAAAARRHDRLCQHRHQAPARSLALVRTMARAALVDDELGVGVKVAVGFAMSCPSRSGCLALRVAGEAALACPAGEIITLDAIWIVLRSRRG
jgi:hypothetical protein